MNRGSGMLKISNQLDALSSESCLLLTLLLSG